MATMAARQTSNFSSLSYDDKVGSVSVVGKENAPLSPRRSQPGRKGWARTACVRVVRVIARTTRRRLC
jgi:hypothetical protein